MKNVRVIQVGAGGFGLSWLEVISKSSGIELVGVADLVPENHEKANEVLKDDKVQYFEQYADAFRALEADIAIIVTPPQTHKQVAVDALKAGLHVFMEKPIAQTIEDAIELQIIAKKYPQRVMISQNYRWRPEIQALKKAVEKQIAGPIEYVEWVFRRATNFGGWRDHYKEIVIEDMSIHHFDLMRYLLGKNASTVYAKSKRPSWSWFKGNPTASVTMTFEDTLVNYFASWVTSGPETSWNGDIKLHGQKGVIELTNDVPAFVSSNGQKTLLSLPEMERVDREYSLYEMVKALEENREPVTSLDDNLNSFGIVGAAVESIQTSNEIVMEQYLKQMEASK